MTAPERLNARPAAIHPSRRRAPARNAEVRSNSDNNRNETRPKMQNRPHLVMEPESALPKPSLPALAAPYRSSGGH